MKYMELLTTAEVAAACRVSPRTAIDWIAKGRIPALRLGPKAIRVRAEDLERFLEGGEKP